MKKTVFCILFVVFGLTSAFSQQLDVVAYDRALFAQLESEPVLFEKQTETVLVAILDPEHQLGIQIDG